MTTLSVSPSFPVFTDRDGSPLENGYIWIGTAALAPITNPISVYWDAARTQLAAQPIRTLNGYPSNAGTPARLYVGSDYSMLVQDAKGTLVYSSPNATERWSDVVVTGADASEVTFLQAGTGADPRTVESKLRDAITPQDFGAVGDGIADDTSALQEWANRAGLLTIPAGTYKITSAVALSSNTRIIASRGAVIQTAVANISLFTATTKSNVHISGLKFKSTATGTVAYVGGVKFDSCTDSRVADCLFEGMQWAGVLLDACTRCIVQGNYFTGWLGTVQDAADVCLYNNCAFCEVLNNECFGGCHTGIMVQDPYAGLIPRKCLILGNRIGQHTAYGIALYVPGISGSGDTDIQIVNNYVENIQGSYSTNTSSGAGIYAVGAYIGGVQISGNTIVNCCVQTLDRALTPAGIGINGTAAGVTKPFISNNSISGMEQGDGINVSSAPGGAIVSNNVVNIPSGNDGSGPGGATLLGSGIRIEASNNVECLGNTCVVSGDGSAVFQYANGVASSTITITGGHYQSADAATVRVTQNGGFTITNLIVAGINAINSGSTNYAISMDSVVGAVLSNNIAYAPAFEALRINGCTQVRVSGGAYTSGSTPAISTSGTCTGSFIAQSVYFGTSSAAVSNAGTGCAISWRNNAAPATGTWAVGDTTEQSVPAVGSPTRWRCTVAGTPGTWVSEGNL
jgi:hypothetical protein